MENLKTFEEFKFRNPFKREIKIESETLPPKEGKIIVNVSYRDGNSSQAYLNDDIIKTKCGKTGKISEIFSNIGTDEEGRFICRCNNCGSNGILMDKHIIQ